MAEKAKQTYEFLTYKNAPDVQKLDVKENGAYDGDARIWSSKGYLVKEWAYCDDQNPDHREAMEDRFIINDPLLENDQLSIGLYGVLDGHGGDQVVIWIQEEIPRRFKKELDIITLADVGMAEAEERNDRVRMIIDKLFDEINEELKDHDGMECGSTACLAFIFREKVPARPEPHPRMCYVANIGDARAVMVIQDSKVVRISVDHKASDDAERRRIIRAGGKVESNRVDGNLAVSRAFGDLELAPMGVISRPHVKRMILYEDFTYLVIASDGLWDTLEDKDTLNKLRKKDAEGNPTSQYLENTLQMAEVLLDHALKGPIVSKDNTSVLVIKF